METRQSAHSSQSKKDPIEATDNNMEVNDTIVIEDVDELECTLNEDELR
jgi:hypothetical protein